jgi:hypothetical protein
MSHDVVFQALLDEIRRTHPEPAPEPPRPCGTCGVASATDGDDCARCWRRKADEQRLAEVLADRLRTIPPRYQWAAWDNQAMASRVHGLGRLRASLANAHSRNVVLLGPAGSGKSSALAALVREAVEGGAAPRWVSARDLATTRSQHDLGEASELERAAMRAPILALDDLGNDRRTQLSAVDDVLLERHDMELVTWVTTALGPSEVTARYGAGIARRVFEGAIVVEVGRRP